MKKTSVIILIALALACGTGLGFLIASPGKTEGTTLIPNAEIASADLVTPPVNEENLPAKPSLPATTVTWQETNFDFGDVVQSKPVRHRYEFTNNGTQDLVIDTVKPTCGCTTPSWSKEPIKPGAKGFVEAEFNAAAEGVFKKSVSVIANTEPSVTVLNFTGTVIKP
jgi:hypothetical protein